MTEPVQDAEGAPAPDPPAAVPLNDPETNPALARKNMVFGWALFGVFLVLFVGIVLVPFAYLAIVD